MTTDTDNALANLQQQGDRLRLGLNDAMARARRIALAGADIPTELLDELQQYENRIAMLVWVQLWIEGLS